MSEKELNNAPESVEPEPEAEDSSRRSFIRFAVAGTGLAYAAAIGYPLYRYLNSPVETSIAMAAVKEVNLKDADKIPKGSALVFKFGVSPALLIHHADDSWIAMSAVCTHMGCTVAYNPSKERIVCECHGGEYDPKTGDNISGPPPRPLSKYNVKIEEGNVTVTRA